MPSVEHRSLLILSTVLIAIDLVLALNYTASSCGQTMFTANRGTINFPAQATPIKSCTYTVTADRGRRLFLQWTHFRVDGNMPSCISSYVAVYTG